MRKYLALLLLASSLWGNAIAEPTLTPGTIIGRHIYGLATDANNEPLLVDEKPLIFSENSFEKRVTSGQGEAVITAFGDSIGSLYLTRLDESGEHSLDTVSFAFGDVEGIAKPRDGTVTPWNTVLFAEAEWVDAARPQSFVDAYKPFYKGKAEMVNPYNYGWVGEAIILAGERHSKIIKNFAVGRVSASELTLMPDGRSLYLFDRLNHGILYLFVSDGAGSMTSGALYGVMVDAGKVNYELLGRSSALKMKFKLKRIVFDDLFESKSPQGGKCPDGFTSARELSLDECLKLVGKNSNYAGLFEPARLLAIKREGESMSRFSRVSFTAGKVELTTRSGKTGSYVMAVDEKMGSQYIIQGSKQ